MILLFDIGNSRIKWAQYQAGEILASTRYDFADGQLPATLLDDIVLQPGAVYLASVGGNELERQLTTVCRQRWGLTPVSLHSMASCGSVRNGYDNPAMLGVDRWAAIIAAYRIVRRAVVVIDCGTACTADFVDVDGKHLGGAIMPGLQLMQQGLSSATARIGAIANSDTGTAPGTTTDSCVRFGVIQAAIAFIERMQAIAAESLGKDVVTVITGGDAAQLLVQLNSHVRHESELVFMGMGAMVEEMGRSLSS